jgi:hypothetical protein
MIFATLVERVVPVESRFETKPYWDRVNKRTGKPILSDRKYLRPYLNDEVVVDVLERIKKRADEGMAKYGVPMTRTDVDTIGWLRHAQEEALDLAIYLERLIRDFQAHGNEKTDR